MVEYDMEIVFFEVQFMKTAGIIAEYNPFHPGHQYQIEYIRQKLGADFVIVAMSGDYVQRGTPALLEKHLRAEMALRCGADLVLELPISVSTASAEFFARGGVQLLDRLGVTDLLCFGSEAGELAPLMELAEILLEEPEEYRLQLKNELALGASFPRARYLALSHYCQKPLAGLLESPNNILGIEYCKAIRSLKSRILPVTLRREGASYHKDALSDGELPSATAIRESVRTNRHQKLSEALPPEIRDLFLDALSQKEFLLEDDFDSLLHYRLLSLEQEDLCHYLDVSPELAQKILNRRNEYRGFLSFAALLNTRETTQTRIQRALLHILLGIRGVPEEIPYARILGFRKTAEPLLKEIKQKGRIPLLSRPAAADSVLDEPGLSLLRESAYASSVYESLLCKKAGRNFIHEYTKPVIVL